MLGTWMIRSARVAGGALRHMAASARRLRRDRSGGFAMMFAFSLVPMVGLMGFATDFAMLTSAKAQLDKAADAAALGAIARSTRDTLANASAGKYTSATVPTVQMQAEGEKMFDNVLGAATQKITATRVVTVSKVLPNLTSKVTYSASVPSYFGGVVGLTSYAVTGESQSATNLVSYVDFYLALDTSQSMGLAATPADIANLSKLNKTKNYPQGCAFGCHTSVDALMPKSNFDIARANGITLRVDALRTSVIKLIDTATATAQVANQYRIGLYTFERTLATLTDLTNNLPAAKTAAAGIDLAAMVPYGYGQTYLDVAIPGLNKKMTDPGDGLTAGTAKKFLFIVTDGVQDEGVWGTPQAKRTKQLDPSLCDAIKARKITIAVLYTTYTPIPSDSIYNELVKPFDTKISPALQACASPGYFFEATHAGDIDAAMQKMFIQASESVRLSM